MKKFVVFASVIALSGGLRASWYWPFGSEGGERKVELRISELMEPASTLIDEASDLASDDKIGEAVEKYRAALTELDRIERENPDRAQSAEFATLRNKRAYVNAAIDSLLLEQVRSNAKAVATTDTTELEKRLAAERGKTVKPSKAPESPKPAELSRPAEAAESPKPSKSSKLSKPSKPLSTRERTMRAISDGKFAEAEKLIARLLNETPNGAAALNLKAALMARQGKYKDAEAALDQAIQSHPKNHFAYYNMARLMVQQHPDDTSAAKRYYETGRAMGGPVDEGLEALVR